MCEWDFVTNLDDDENERNCKNPSPFNVFVVRAMTIPKLGAAYKK